MKFKIFFLVVFFATAHSFGQEILTNTGFVPLSQNKSCKNQDTLELPFFDDFSQISEFSKHFSDNSVSIAQTQAKFPPSIGVAMFDALDENGDFYAGYGQSAQADFLTSLPINLEYQSSDSIYFSFFYEPQGYLDAPDDNDSLVLQFFAPNQNTWQTVWSATNDDDVSFHPVNIKISDTAFLQKGFKFRFYNVISMIGNQYPSFVSDCDFWFVDYIYLNTDRTYNDLIFKDIAFQYPIKFKIDDYLQVPYSHYQSSSSLNHNYYINFRNNDPNIRSIDSMYIVFEDKNNALPNDTLYLGSYNFQGSSDLHVNNENINFSFPDVSSDQLKYRMKTVLVTDYFDSTCNNVIYQNKDLTTDYAYDDGTAENGYGLYGEGTMYAYVAQKFYTYKTDRLSGLIAYFNKTYNNEQPYYFYLVVWENDPETGKPGEIIYEQPGLEINHEKLPGFMKWQLDSAVTVSDTFYVGWKKTYQQIMNLGVDRTSTDNNYKYYNITGQWLSSTVDGVLMMRPVFGDVNLAKLPNNQGVSVTIYPNPARDFIYIKSHEQENFSYQITDMSGKIFLKGNISQGEALDVSDLNTGLYLLVLNNSDFVRTLKFIKR